MKKRPIKVYIASSFDLIPRIIDIVRILEAHKLIIAVKWWENQEVHNNKFIFDSDRFYSNKTKEVYEKDINGIKKSNCLLFIADNTKRRYTGANIELGIAIALGLDCYAIGELINSAMYYPIVRCSSINDFLRRVI